MSAMKLLDAILFLLISELQMVFSCLMVAGSTSCSLKQGTIMAKVGGAKFSN